MDILVYLIPIALVMSLMGLGLFFWNISKNQFDDMEGNAQRILFDDDIKMHDSKTKKPLKKTNK